MTDLHSRKVGFPFDLIQIRAWLPEHGVIEERLFASRMNQGGVYE
jgi:hypothetical protein